MPTAKKIISSFNQFSAPINKQMQTYLRRSNIPAFSMMLKKLTLDTFFYNHEIIEKALGAYTVHINNLVYDCLVESVAKSIYASINPANETPGPRVGWWTMASITDLIRRNSSFCLAGEKEEMIFVTYGFAQVDQETLDKILNGEVDNVIAMKFADFSQDKFNAIINQIITNVVAVINGMEQSYWPTVYKIAEDETVDEKLIGLFYNSIGQVVGNETEDDDVKTNAEYFLSAMTLFCSSVLVNGGIALEVIQDVLAKTSVNYDDSTTIKKGKLTVPATSLIYSFNSNPEINVMLEFTNDLIDTACQNKPGELTKTFRNELGRKLRHAVSDFCSYVFIATAE